MPRYLRYLAANECRDWVASDAQLRSATLDGIGQSLVVVVDYADESYVPATLPALRGRDRRRLRARRLEREFPGALLTTLVTVRARAADGTVDAVMIAVGGGASLGEMLTELGARHALRAVYTPALLAALWVRLAGLRERRVLIVMPTPAGVRLVFVDGGQAALSRLTAPLAGGTTASEIARTVQYLQNMQRIERGVPLELWFWGVADQEAAEHVPGGDQTRLGRAPCVNGLPDPQRGGFAALLELAARRPSGPQLAPDTLRAGWLARRLQRAARWAAAAIVLLGGCAAAWLGWQASVATEAALALAAERQAYERESRDFEASLARQGLTPLEWQLLPEAAAQLQQGAVDLADAFAAAADGFGAVPDLQIAALEVRAGDPLADVDAGAAGAMTTEPAASPADASARLEADCLTQPFSAAAMQIDFGLAAGLGVRRRDAALRFVREAASRLGPWQGGPALRRLGSAESLVVAAGVDAAGDAAGAASQWSVCLRRTGAA